MYGFYGACNGYGLVGKISRLLSLSVRTVHVVFSTVRFQGGGKQCPKIQDTILLACKKLQQIGTMVKPPS